MMSEEQEVAANELSDFHSGFGGTNVPLSDEIDTASNETETQADDPVPEYVQITRQQFEDMQTRLGKIDDLQTAYAKTSGSIGNLNQIIERLQAATPKGQKVEFTADDVADLTSEFGDELGAAQLKVLQKISGKLNGTGAAFDPAQVDSVVQARIAESSKGLREEVSTAIRQEMLSDLHPDWTTVRGTPEFLAWKDKLPSDAKNTLNTTNSVSYLAGKLTEFKDSLKKQKSATDKGNLRQKVMASAVQPTGDGGHAQAKSADDDFHSGFNKIAGKR